jgi:hypothetical protein
MSCCQCGYGELTNLCSIAIVGKTVITIGLIAAGVANARAHCDMKKGRSSATLVVVPPGLVQQWDDERRVSLLSAVVIGGFLLHISSLPFFYRLHLPIYRNSRKTSSSAS